VIGLPLFLQNRVLPLPRFFIQLVSTSLRNEVIQASRRADLRWHVVQALTDLRCLIFTRTAVKLSNAGSSGPYVATKIRIVRIVFDKCRRSECCGHQKNGRIGVKAILDHPRILQGRRR
jgi:hypothetical protein